MRKRRSLDPLLILVLFVGVGLVVTVALLEFSSTDARAPGRQPIELASDLKP